MYLLQDFNEPSTTLLRKVFSTCIAFAKYVEWKEPDVIEAEQKVYKVLEENRENQERIEVLRREYDMACNDQENKELVCCQLACCVVKLYVNCERCCVSTTYDKASVSAMKAISS
jgi:hypothetical protein